MTQSTPTSPSDSAYFVSAAWLGKNQGAIRDGAAVLVETGAILENGVFRTALYEYANEGHIPGAVFADLFFQFSDSSSPLGFTKPSTLQFQNAAAQLGITPDTEIVVYDRAQGEWASRLLWLFAAWGHKRVRVLDGGWLKWKSLGGAVEHGINKPVSKPRGTDFSQFDESYFASMDDVKSAIESGGTTRLICGLPAAVFSGEAGTLPRKGHIPTSINLPYSTLLAEDNTLKPHFQAPAPAGRTIVYCGAGIVATLVGLRLKEAGQRKIAIYDGSLREWTSDASLPLELGAA